VNQPTHLAIVDEATRLAYVRAHDQLVNEGKVADEIALPIKVRVTGGEIVQLQITVKVISGGEISTIRRRTE